ncbi:hypothetical protein L208DRAFT_1181424, partial [Tricholoma matsutake]
IATHIAKTAWDFTGFRFNYKKKQVSKTCNGITMYTFYCAQLKGKQTKHKLTNDTRKRRAHMTMDWYQCDGWLHVTVDESDLSTVCIHITHYRWHHPYTDISILDNIAEEIEKLKDLPAAKVSEILPTLEGNDLMLTQKQVYAHW